MSVMAMFHLLKPSPIEFQLSQWKQIEYMRDGTLSLHMRAMMVPRQHHMSQLLLCLCCPIQLSVVESDVLFRHDFTVKVLQGNWNAVHARDVTRQQSFGPNVSIEQINAIANAP